MGALCGKESKGDDGNFAGAGRPLGAAPPAVTSAPLPAGKRVGGPPRTLGGGDPSTAAPGAASSDPASDARRRAAEAAEARDKAARDKAGKLGQQLRQQKGLTDNEVNKKANADAERERLIRENQQQMTYN